MKHRMIVLALIPLILTGGCRRGEPEVVPEVKVRPPELSTGEKLAAAVQQMGGKVEQDEKSADKAVVDLTSSKVTDAGLAELPGLEKVLAPVLGAIPPSPTRG